MPIQQRLRAGQREKVKLFKELMVAKGKEEGGTVLGRIVTADEECKTEAMTRNEAADRS